MTRLRTAWSVAHIVACHPGAGPSQRRQSRRMYALFEDSRQVPRRPRDVRGRQLGAGRARLGQARQGQGRQRAAALRQARAGRADRAGAGAGAARSTWTWPGSSRPRPSSASPTWRATISSAKAGTDKQAAALFRLFEAPHYFRRLGKGQFKKAPEETVKAALLGIERKKQQAAQIEAWAGELVAGQLPGAGARAALPHPVQARQERRPSTRPWSRPPSRAQRAPLDLLKAAGAIDSPYQFHWRRFLFEQFPKGTAFPALAAPADQGRRCRWPPVQAFSIDDSATTEIDDALSVQGLGTRHGGVRRPHRRAGRWPSRPIRRWTRWRASACPPSTCRAGS